MNDNVDKFITFNDEGICNHCTEYNKMMNARTSSHEELVGIIDKIKFSGQNKEYDCVIGVSGGVDSSYLAYIVKKKYNLRPLAVHLDNGWNSELAVNNIEKMLKNLEIDLITYVIDWDEFKNIQSSFLKASVPDGEVPTDHAINALLWSEASKRNIKYILSGMNYKTESTNVNDWSYGHSDFRYIKNIQKKYGKKAITSLPNYNFFDLFYYTFIKNIRQVAILNYENYDNELAMKVLQEELGWIYYGGKHHESVYTRWYQGFFLPKKFKIDKRYLHFSNLIKNNNMTREQAIEDLKMPAYNTQLQEEDTRYVLKKLGISESDFNYILNKPIKSFRNYKNSFLIVSALKKFVYFLRKINVYPK